MTFYHFDAIFRQLRPTAARSISHMPARPTGAAHLLAGPERLSCSPQHCKRVAKVIRVAAHACTTTCFSSIRAWGTGEKEYEQPPHCTVGARVQQLGCARQQLTLLLAQLERGVPATRTAARDVRCPPQPPLFNRGPPLCPHSHLRRCAPRTKTPSEFGRCAHSGALQSLGQCAVNFGPILLKLKYVTALAPVVDVVASPAAAELDAPCCPKQAMPVCTIVPTRDGFYCRAY